MIGRLFRVNDVM